MTVISERIIIPGQRLGRLATPPAKRAKALLMANYLKTLPPAPASLDLTTGVSTWPMFLNNRLGDCTCAAAAHLAEVYGQAVNGTPTLVEDGDVLALYEALGYNPNDPATDQGADEMSVMETWRTVGLGGHKLYAYAAVDFTNLDLFKASMWLFYGLSISLELPVTAQSQSVWDVVSAPPSQNEPGTWGGHEVAAVKYDPSGITVITWGAEKLMTWAFLAQYGADCWCAIPVDFRTLPTKPLSNGFDDAQLEADLLEIGPVNEGA